MSLASLIAADVSSVLMNEDDFAEAVTRYPLGDTSAGSAATGVFFENEPEREIGTGERIVRRGTLHVASSVTVDPRDSWLIRSVVWQAIAVEAAHLGSRLVQVQRDDKTATRRTDGARLL